MWFPPSDIDKALRACKRDDRNRLVLEAAQYLNRRIVETASGFKTTEKAKDYLLKLVKYVSDTVQIVRLVVKGRRSCIHDI